MPLMIGWKVIELQQVVCLHPVLVVVSSTPPWNVPPISSIVSHLFLLRCFPSLSFPNLLVLLNLFFQILMLSYRPLMFCLAVPFASDASLQTNYLSLILFFTSLLASVVLLFACCSFPAVVTALFESCPLINLFKVISIPGVFCFSSHHHMLMLILVLPLPNCPLFCRMVHPFRTSTWNCVLLSIYPSHAPINTCFTSSNGFLSTFAILPHVPFK